MVHKKLLEEVMEMLLYGNSEELIKLKQQFKQSTVREENSKVGFYINFELDNDNKYLVENKTFQIGDVYGTVDGKFASVGFILFIKNGKLLMLEGYTNGIIDKWPEDDRIVLTYSNGTKEREKSK